nr:hypothetical protein [Flavobacterium sp. MC2016-06]
MRFLPLFFLSFTSIY